MREAGSKSLLAGILIAETLCARGLPQEEAGLHPW